MAVRGDASDVDITEARQHGHGGMGAKAIRLAGALFDHRPGYPDADAPGMGVVGRDADHPPFAHHRAERAPVRPGIPPGAVTEHDRREGPLAVRLEEDAFKVEGRAFERAGQRPFRALSGLGVAGDDERGSAPEGRCFLRSAMVARGRPIQEREDESGSEYARHPSIEPRHRCPRRLALRWVRPLTSSRSRSSSGTDDGLRRHAKFLGRRDDKQINNVEFDHADIYADLGGVCSAFRRLSGWCRTADPGDVPRETR